MYKKIKDFDHLLFQELPLLLLLLAVITLRIPNLFEPYWYGDEGIYLTIGIALRQGSQMYLDIIDHKTPLIYYFSLVPSLTTFRALLMAWMVMTTIGFYHMAIKLLKSIRAASLATIFFVVFTTLPWFEGNIANGELFVMGFIIWGGLLLMYTSFWGGLLHLTSNSKLPDSKKFIQPLQTAASTFLSKTQDVWLYTCAGVLFALAILTKVPALFDVLAFLSIGWFNLVRGVDYKAVWSNKNKALLTKTVTVGLCLVGIIAVPIGLSIVYYVLKNAGQAYLDFGLLYNFKYVQNWGLPFTNSLLIFLFSLPGKTLTAAVVIVFLTAYTKRLTPSFLVAASWFVFSLFASLLSNRPYPHYFLQVIPSLSLLLGYFYLLLLPKYRVTQRDISPWIERGYVIFSFSLFVGVLYLLKVGLYPTAKYYRTFYLYVTNQMSRSEYYQSFNHLMEDNYKAAMLIKQEQGEHLFIWGTNPMLYALAEKSPPGRFTVSFHIKDFDAYQETISAVEAKKPKFIVTMNDEYSVLPGLDELLHTTYIPDSNFDNFTLWIRHEGKL